MNCDDTESQTARSSAKTKSIAFRRDGHCHSGNSERRVHVTIILSIRGSLLLLWPRDKCAYRYAASQLCELEAIRFGWGGIWGDEVKISLSVCLRVCVSLSVFHHSSQCGVMSLGLQQQTPLRFTSLLQLHLYPNSYQITRRAFRCDMLLTHWKPRFRKRDICLLYHGCNDWYRSKHMQTGLVLIQKKKKNNPHTQIQIYPIPCLSLVHSCEKKQKKGTCAHIHAMDNKKDTTYRGERTTLLYLYKVTFRTTFSIFLFHIGKGSLIFMLTKNANVRFLEERRDIRRLKKSNKHCASF